MSSTTPDRRLKSRIKIEGEMTYQLEMSGAIFVGELEDLSDVGARVWIEQDLPPSSRLYCRFEADDSEQEGIEFTAILLHNHSQQRRGVMYGYGCTIEDIKLPD